MAIDFCLTVPVRFTNYGIFATGVQAMWDGIKWWLWAGNPRIFYMVAGGLMTAGALIVGGTAVLAMPPILYFIWGTLGGWTILTGILLVRWQRARERSQHFISAGEMHAEMEELARQAMFAIGETLNDQMESAGHGRPITFDRISYH